MAALLGEFLPAERPIDDHRIAQVLCNLDSDVGETTDVAAEQPEVVARLLAQAEQFREELGDRLTKRKGSGVWLPGRVGGR